MIEERSQKIFCIRDYNMYTVHARIASSGIVIPDGCDFWSGDDACKICLNKYKREVEESIKK